MTTKIKTIVQTAKYTACIGPFLAVLLTTDSCMNFDQRKVHTPLLVEGIMRLQPYYAEFNGSFETYVQEHRDQLGENSPALQVAADVSRCLMDRSIDVYSYEEEEYINMRNRELNRDCNFCVPLEFSESTQLRHLATQLNILVSILPEGTKGNFQPFYSSTNPDIQSVIAARSLNFAKQTNPIVNEVLNRQRSIRNEVDELYRDFYTRAINECLE